MHPVQERLLLARRHFLTSAAGGIGGVALASLLNQNGARAAVCGLAPKATRCIFLFMEGGASQPDLFNYRPKLNRNITGNYHDKLVTDVAPRNLLEGQFAFLDKKTARFLGTPMKFSQHGGSGMWFSELLPELSRHADKICMLNSVVSSQF